MIGLFIFLVSNPKIPLKYHYAMDFLNSWRVENYYIFGSLKGEERSISGWKRAGIIGTQFLVGNALALGVNIWAFFSYAGPYYPDFPPHEEDMKFIIYHTIGHITLTNSCVWFIGRLWGDKNRFLKSTLGTAIGVLIADAIIYKRFKDNSIDAVLVSFPLPVIGAIMGNNI